MDWLIIFRRIRFPVNRIYFKAPQSSSWQPALSEAEDLAEKK
jgi:hypothetical protein